MIQTSLIIPTLNEAENLPTLLERIHAVLHDRAYEVLLVDDNSKDNTKDVAAELSKKYPLRLIVREIPKDGLGGAVLHGIHEARGKYLVVMDADLQHPPEKLPELIAPLEDPSSGADFVLGSRNVAGGSTGEAWGAFRKINSEVATMLARPFAGRTRDPMSGFFALRRETFDKAQRLTPLGYKIGLELMCKCRVQHVREVPIHFALRTRGQSKLSIREQFRYLEHLSRLYDFCFPRLSPIVKFSIVVALSFCVSLGFYESLLRYNVRPLLAPIFAYPAAIFVTAIFHRRYLRTQREFIVEHRPWLDFLLVALAEWSACAVTSIWLDARASGAHAIEIFSICFFAGIITRYILRKELLQDVRGLRQELRERDLRQTLACVKSPAAITRIDVKADVNRRADARFIGLALLAFALLSLAASKTSEGFLEADGCTHYQFARFAFAEPHYLVNIWGRPFCTALYAVPAQLAGRFGVRCASLLLALAISLIAYLIAKEQGFRRPIPALALIFTLAQPLVFLHSISELTELPFAFLLGLAFLSYQRKRWMYFAMLCSILPLARPEGFVLLALAVVALCGRARFAWILFLPIPLIIWSYAGWTVYGSPKEYPWYVWLARNWPYAEKSAYVSGSIWHFVLFLPVIVSPIAVPAVIVGIWEQTRNATRSLRKTFCDHQSRCAMLIVAIPLAVMLGHSVLYATGRMASSGEIRYMLIVAPFWAILAARGWDRIFTWRRWQIDRQIPIALLAASAPLLANCLYPVVPLRFSSDWHRAQSVVEWSQSNQMHALYPRIASAHPGIFYFLSVSPTDFEHVAQWEHKTIEHPPLGTVLVWDWVYSLHNADTARVITQDELRAAGWVPLSLPQLESAPDERAGPWKIYLSPRDVNGKPTDPRAVR